MNRLFGQIQTTRFSVIRVLNYQNQGFQSLGLSRGVGESWLLNRLVDPEVVGIASILEPAELVFKRPGPYFQKMQRGPTREGTGLCAGNRIAHVSIEYAPNLDLVSGQPSPPSFWAEPSGRRCCRKTFLHLLEPYILFNRGTLNEVEVRFVRLVFSSSVGARRRV